MGEMGLIWECFLDKGFLHERMFCPRKTLERIASQNRKQWIDCNWNVGSRRKACSSEWPSMEFEFNSEKLLFDLNILELKIYSIF